MASGSSSSASVLTIGPRSEGFRRNCLITIKFRIAHGTPIETINYTYNADGWLYSEVGVATAPQGVSIGATIQNWSLYYGYDADGNRLETNSQDFLIAHSQADEGQSTFWKYNANNEMYYNDTYNPDQDNPSNTYTTYTYDNNGNQVQAVSYTEHQQGEDGDDNDSDQTWTYDVRGEMVKFVDGNNTTTTYTYDDAGNRVKEVRGSTTTTYLIDSNNPQGYAQTIEEHTNGATNPSVTYFVGPNGAQGQANGSTVIYMLRDARGYAVAVINYIGAFSGKVGRLLRSTASCFRAAISRRACSAKRRAESSVLPPPIM